MSYVMRSNVTVSDPTGKFPYYTRFGVGSSFLKKYIDELDNLGFSMQKSEFQLFQGFIDGLIADGVWDFVKEVYPLFGNSVDCASVKLKTASGSLLMGKLGGISDADFEFSNGQILGKAVTTYSNNYSPRFDTGIQASLLAGIWGITAFIDALPLTTSDENAQALWGASHVESASAQTAVDFINGPILSRMGVSNSSGRIQDSPLDSMAAGFVQVDANESLVSGYYPDEIVVSGSFPSRDVGADANVSLHLFAKNGYGANASITQSYSGKVRFFMLTDGGLSIADRDAIRGRVETLMIGLGRNFS